MAGKGVGYGAIGVGVLLVFSGVQNKGILETLRDVVGGNQPTPGPAQKLVDSSGAESSTVQPGTDSTSNSVEQQPSIPSGGGSLQSYAKKLLTLYGWGDQWAEFNKLELSEAGWNPLAKNRSSGAFGLAQALGHGNGSATQGTKSNMYGGYGLSDADAKKANSGDGKAQLVWMMNYIKSRYNNPRAAWAFHIKNNWY